MLVCVRCRKLQGVSVWAPEEGGPRPGLPDTGGKAKHLALILTRILVHAHTHTHMHVWRHTHTCSSVPPGSPLLTDASCLLAQSTLLHTYKHTNAARPLAPLQVDPGAGCRGSSTLRFCFRWCWILFRSPAPDRNDYNSGTRGRQDRKLTFACPPT